MIYQRLHIFKLKSIKFNMKYFVVLVPVKSMGALKVKHLMNMTTMMTMVETMKITILSEITMKMKTMPIRMIKMIKMVMVQQQPQVKIQEPKIAVTKI